MPVLAYGKPAGGWALPFFLIALGAVGLFFGLPGPVLHLPPLALLFPFSLYLLAATASRGKQAFWRGWLLGLCGNGAALYWLVFPMRDVAGLPLFLAAFCVLPLFAYLALFNALAALGLYVLRSSSLLGAKGRFPVLCACVIGGLGDGGYEGLCGWLFTGFPWLCLSTAFAFWPEWVQAASFTGAYGLSALFATSAFFAAAALLERGSSRVIAIIAALFALSLLPGYGLVRLSLPMEEEGRSPFSLIMVQGNIDQSIKWEPSFQKATLDHYLALSEKALRAYDASRSGSGPDLVLWPETAMPFHFYLQHDYAASMRAFARNRGLYLGFGAPHLRRSPGGSALTNRLHLLAPSGAETGVYDKEHLVPFGEYTPLSADIPFLRDILQGMNFAPGAGNELLALERGSEGPLLLGALICYEAIFPALAQERTAQGAEILVNISNDGWFRKSSAPLQHLAHAALRSVEQSRSLVRATNTGLTAAFDRYGRITKRLDGQFVEGTLAAKAAPCRDITLYHRLRPVPELLMVALALFPILVYRVRNMKYRNNHAATA